MVFALTFTSSQERVMGTSDLERFRIELPQEEEEEENHPTHMV